MRRMGLLLALSAVLLTTTVEARIYQYEDDKGRKVFVDRLSKVPAKYRNQLNSREELVEKLTPEQQQQRDLERKKNEYKYEIKRRRDKIHDAMERWITDFSFHQNRIVVPVKVRYGGRSKTLSLVMDTGASMTVIHRAALAGLGAQLKPGNSAQVADGSVVKTNRVSLDQVDIGPYKSSNVSTAVIDFKGGSEKNQGLLGMDFLYNAHYELDKQNQKIIWEPEKYQELQQQLQDLDELEAQMNAPAVSEN